MWVYIQAENKLVHVSKGKPDVSYMENHFAIFFIRAQCV